MPRGVLLVNAMDIAGKRVHTCTIDEAFGVGLKRTQYPLQCNSNDSEFLKLRDKPAAVRQAGERLYNALVSHQDGQAFFAQQQPQSPLFIHLDTPDGEELPWEILWETQRNFMALDPQGRWPIARLASPAQRSVPLQRLIGSRLRIAVVLAAAREMGGSEWDGIAAALTSYAAPIDLLALVSEDDVKTQIGADAAAWAVQGLDRNVEVEFIGDGSALMARLRAHVPNVIHFFCHGVADVRPQLELETRSDRKTKKDRGSVSLGSETLAELALVSSLWLVTLNCCQGAKTAPHLHSLARDLVAQGVPAVVAMRESVDVIDANLFALHLYTGLLPELKVLFDMRARQAAPALPVPELLWLRAVDDARRQLSVATNRVAESSAEWTYPVLYVHRDALELLPRELKVATISAEKRRELVTEMDLLRAIHATLRFATDVGVDAHRATLEASIRQIEAQLAGN